MYTAPYGTVTASNLRSNDDPPYLNAHCERFVRSIKEEAWEQMVMLDERSLHYAMRRYLTHYHTECNHQGLDNHLTVREGQ